MPVSTWASAMQSSVQHRVNCLRTQLEYTIAKMKALEVQLEESERFLSSLTALDSNRVAYSLRLGNSGQSGRAAESHSPRQIPWVGEGAKLPE
jgi:hypothetical protein